MAFFLQIMGKKKEYNLSEIDTKQADDNGTDKKESFTAQEYDGNTKLNIIRIDYIFPSKRSIRPCRLTKEKNHCFSGPNKISSLIFNFTAFHVLAIVSDGVTDQPCKQSADGDQDKIENDSSGDVDQTEGEGNFSTSA